MAQNGSRRAANAAGYSVSHEFPEGAEPTPQPKVKQAIRGRPLPVDWVRGVASDARISPVHRLILIGIALHHRDHSGFDVIARQIGVDRATVLRAVDIGIRRGWLADSPKAGGRVLFTFPVRRNPQAHSLPLAEPSPTPRRAL
jgi:hypothetical protein